jgi:hypothetical protein
MTDNFAVSIVFGIISYIERYWLKTYSKIILSIVNYINLFTILLLHFHQKYMNSIG